MEQPMSDFYSTTPKGDGQGPSADQSDQSPPNKLKYTFVGSKVILFDCEVFPGPRWCCGFLGPNGVHECIDGDANKLARAISRIASAGFTLVGYNSQAYDEPVLRPILAGEDAYAISHALVHYNGMACRRNCGSV